MPGPATPRPPRPRIACLGEAMVELSGLDWAGGTARLGVAGDAYNTAVYLARLLPGAEVAFATALGDDALSDAMAARMQAEGVSPRLLRRLPGRLPGLYAIALDGGERSFHYWRRDSAARAMMDVLGPADLAGLDLLYLTGISVAILPPEGRARLLACCEALRAAGGRLAFDGNHRPRLWGAEDARAALAPFWARADIALPSREDEEALAPGEGLDGLVARIGSPEVVVKDGARGPRVWSGGWVEAGPFPPAPAVVDTTAAGDSFNAAYLAARLRGLPPAGAARAGHALAARVVGHPGAIIPASAMSPP